MKSPLTDQSPPTMPHAIRSLLVVASLFGALSCGEPVAARADVEVYTRSLAVFVRNNLDDEPLYSMIFDQRQEALVRWAPCIEESCGRIAPNSARSVTAESLGSNPGDTVLVFTWRRVAGVADAPVAGPVTLHRIRLVLRIDP